MDERFRALPGVRAATVTDMPLVANSTSSTSVSLPGVPKCAGRGGPNTSFISVGPAFFETMQLPILLGRPIDSHDVDGAPHVAVVNEVFATKYFPDQNPIGRRFGLNSDASNVTIVGVAKNARYSSLKNAIPPVTYISYLQNVLRFPPGPCISNCGPQATRSRWRRAFATLFTKPHRRSCHEHDDAIATHRQHHPQERTFADLCTAFAVLALSIMACVGLYGTMAYAVSRRTNEIGIRMALGAERTSYRLVWCSAKYSRLPAVGLAVGLLCAWGTMSAIKSFLFGVKPADPLTMFLAAAVLIAALVLAGFAPALRASRIEPLTALRHE